MDQSAKLRMKRPFKRPLYKPQRKAEEANFKANFKANFSFFTSLSFYCDSGLFFLRNDVWPAMDQEWFPCQQRSLTTRQKFKICCSPSGDVSRPLRKPSMTFLYRGVISFTRLSPSVETDDFIARSKWEISKLADLVAVKIYRGLHNCQRTV